MTVRIVCLLGLNGKLKTEESQINSYHNHDYRIAKDELAYPEEIDNTRPVATVPVTPVVHLKNRLLHLQHNPSPDEFFPLSR